MRGTKRVVFLVLITLLLVGAVVGYRAWVGVYGPAVQFAEESRVLYVASSADFEAVVEGLLALEAIDDERVFRLISERKNYSTRIKPGRYRIKHGMSTNELVNMLRSGEQEPVKVTFNNIARIEALAGRVASYLEADSLAFVQYFHDLDVQAGVSMRPRTFIGLFIPDTYEFWWTTSPQQFVDRMKREHDAFWTPERTAKARALDLDPVEVSTLASIVQAETLRMSDAPTIAGVYLNRLRIGMPLQADPTLKFALGLDSIARVLDRDKQVDSPYNTYRHPGLPPGPINMPEKRFLDAVLNAEHHDYYYFCARADLSGYSEFARNYDQHLVNARKYQRELNRRKIYR